MKYPFDKKYTAIALVAFVVGWLLTNSWIFGLALGALWFTPAWWDNYLKYAKDNPKKLWFKRKLYGWGWTPVTWQGWVSTAVLVIALATLSLTMGEQAGTSTAELFKFWGIFAIITLAFVSLAYKKGEKPRWQWGNDDK